MATAPAVGGEPPGTTALSFALLPRSRSAPGGETPTSSAASAAPGISATPFFARGSNAVRPVGLSGCRVTPPSPAGVDGVTGCGGDAGCW